MRFWGIQSTLSLPGPLWLRVVAPDQWMKRYCLTFKLWNLFEHLTVCKQMTYEMNTISFQTFFIWALLLIIHTWNSSPLRSNLLQLQCTCYTVPKTSERTHGSPLVSACQWPSSQPLSYHQLSHNDSLWA